MRDSEVVASIVAGDPTGLATAYDRYADSLYKYCHTLLGDPADAADAVQDTFVIAAARIEGLHDRERLRCWLYAVARAEVLRSPRPPGHRPARDDAPAVTGGSAGTGGRTGRAGLRALLEASAAGLNADEREIIELQLRQGLSDADVAAVLGVSHQQARTLTCRARDQLEASLGVLLVSRSGRQDCGELATMLAGWDGPLTAPLRERAGQHIGHCATCGARRAAALSPARLLDLSPGAALAAGAAESFRLADSAPDGLKAHTVELATGQGPGAAAHRAAVLRRAGAFTRTGFPPAGHQGTGSTGPARRRGAGMLRGGPRTKIAAAAAVLAAIITVLAVALSGSTARPGLAAPRPANVTAPASASPSAPASVPATLASSVAPPAARGTAPVPAATTTDPVAGTPAQTPPAPGTSATPSSPSPAPATASPSPTARTPPPAPSPSVSQVPPPVPGTLSESPSGGTSQQPRPLLVTPGGGGTPVTLLASGGTVTWSVSVANDPNGAISVSPSPSGTLTPAQPAVTLTVTASQPVRCGRGPSVPCPTVTISPGGAVYVIWTGRVSAGRRAFLAAARETSNVSYVKYYW